MKKYLIASLLAILTLPIVFAELNAWPWSRDRYYGDSRHYGWHHDRRHPMPAKVVNAKDQAILAEGEKFDHGKNYQECANACRAHHMKLIKDHKLPRGYFRQHGQECWKTCGIEFLDEEQD